MKRTAILLGAATLACSDGGPAQPEIGTIPFAIEVVSGANQAAPVASTLPLPVVVRVVDESRRPVPGVFVSFRVRSGSDFVEPIGAETDGRGEARTTWTLSENAGYRGIDVESEGVFDVLRVSAVGEAGPPSGLDVIGGNGQPGNPGSALPELLSVRVHDRFNNTIEGVNVDWVVRAGGGTASPARSPTVAVRGAETRWTIGPQPGDNVLVARAGTDSVVFWAGGRAALSDQQAPVVTYTSAPPSVVVGADPNPPVTFRVGVVDDFSGLDVRSSTGHTVSITVEIFRPGFTGLPSMYAVSGYRVSGSDINGQFDVTGDLVAPSAGEHRFGIRVRDRENRLRVYTPDQLEAAGLQSRFMVVR